MKIHNSSPFIAPAEKSSGRPGETAPRKQPETVEAELQSTNLRQNLKQASDVDVGKVNQVRDAIARGELSLDPDVLAEAVLDMHGR